MKLHTGPLTLLLAIRVWGSQGQVWSEEGEDGNLVSKQSQPVSQIVAQDYSEPGNQNSIVEADSQKAAFLQNRGYHVVGTRDNRDQETGNTKTRNVHSDPQEKTDDEFISTNQNNPSDVDILKRREFLKLQQDPEFKMLENDPDFYPEFLRLVNGDSGARPFRKSESHPTVLDDVMQVLADANVRVDLVEVRNHIDSLYAEETDDNSFGHHSRRGGVDSLLIKRLMQIIRSARRKLDAMEHLLRILVNASPERLYEDDFPGRGDSYSKKESGSSRENSWKNYREHRVDTLVPPGDTDGHGRQLGVDNSNRVDARQRALPRDDVNIALSGDDDEYRYENADIVHDNHVNPFHKTRFDDKSRGRRRSVGETTNRSDDDDTARRLGQLRLRLAHFLEMRGKSATSHKRVRRSADQHTHRHRPSLLEDYSWMNVLP